MSTQDGGEGSYERSRMYERESQAPGHMAVLSQPSRSCYFSARATRVALELAGLPNGLKVQAVRRERRIAADQVQLFTMSLICWWVW